MNSVSPSQNGNHQENLATKASETEGKEEAYVSVFAAHSSQDGTRPPTIDGRIEGTGYVYTMGSYSSGKESAAMKFRKWIQLEIIMLNKRSQAQKEN